MSRINCAHAWRTWLVAILLACCQPVMAGLDVFTSWSTMPPESSANQRTVDFDARPITGEGVLLSHSESLADCTRGPIFNWCLLGSSGGSVDYSGSLAINSGVNHTATSSTIRFNNQTPYVGFTWRTQFNAENTQFIHITLENGSVVTLRNCSSQTDFGCVGAYVPRNWWADVYNFLLGWVFGDAIQYHTIYVQYQPDNGVRVSQVQFATYDCQFCGFLSFDTPQEMVIDNLTYVDTTIPPHHLRVRANVSNQEVGKAVEYTVTACGNAECSLPYVSGVRGTLTFSGASPSMASQVFSIPAGPDNSTTVSMRYLASGTATVGMSAHTPTPTRTPKFICGMGVAPTSDGSCSIDIYRPVHHFRVTTIFSTGLTCYSVTYTIQACANETCSRVPTGGVRGTLMLAGATPKDSFEFITDSTGQATVTARTNTPGTVTASIDKPYPPVLNPLRCGMGEIPKDRNSCDYEAVSTAFSFDVPHHTGGAIQSVVVTAHKSEDSGNRCAIAFASTEKTVSFTCKSLSHNGLTGSVALQGSGAGASWGGCNGQAQSHTLKFGLLGRALMKVRYDEAGQTEIKASFAGVGDEAGLSMSGRDTFVTVPKTLEIVAAAGPHLAGADDKAVTSPAAFTVRALNQGGQVMTAFGMERSDPARITVSKSGQAPTGTSAREVGANITMNEVQSGVATGTVRWAEVGTLNLSAKLDPASNSVYNIPGMPFGGDVSGVGPFVPSRFDVVVKQGSSDTCAQPFTYSAEPFQVAVTAKNADGHVTQNYDGTSGTSPNFAKPVTLAGASSTGAAVSLTGEAIAKSAFDRGVARVKPSHALASKTTAPAVITVSAAENSPGTVKSPSDAGPNNVARVRSGRLFLSNAYGSGQMPLNVPAELQYWSGTSWVRNIDDSCTEVPSQSVVLARYLDSKGAVSSAPWGNVTATGFTADAGRGNIVLSAPQAAAGQTARPTGTIELAVNLGQTANDSSCLSAHPAGGKAERPWLRGPHGGCPAVGGPFDPSARASFGIFAPENHRLKHSRDLF